MLADGTLTPAVTVTTAIEGLKGQGIGEFIFPNNQTIVLFVVTVILLIVFTFQKAGTKKSEKFLDPSCLLGSCLLVFLV